MRAQTSCVCAAGETAARLQAHAVGICYEEGGDRFCRNHAPIRHEITESTRLAGAFYKPSNTLRDRPGNMLECCSHFLLDLGRD